MHIFFYMFVFACECRKLFKPVMKQFLVHLFPFWNVNVVYHLLTCVFLALYQRASKVFLASALLSYGRCYWSPHSSCNQFWKLLFPLHSETLQGAQARTETLENLVNRHFVSLASTRYLKTCMVNAALHWPEIRLAALYVALRSPRDLTVSSNQVSFLSPPPPPLHLSQVSGHLQTGHRDAVHSLCQCLPVWPHRGGPMFTVSLCSRRCQCFPPTHHCTSRSVLCLIFPYL